MKKYLKPVVVLGLVGTLAIGGTLAYLTDVTDQIDNKFAVKEVSIELVESDNEYALIPGQEFAKDPKINVLKDESYVFVEVVETIPTAALGTDAAPHTFDDYIDYAINADTTWKWLQIGTTKSVATGEETKITKVYALTDTTDNLLVVKQGDATTSFPILEGDIADVPKTLTQEMIDLLPEGTESIDLSFTGYAVQTTALTDDSDNAITDPVGIYKVASGKEA